ncbi:hypothetical protein Droror1_Dr00016300 [Drosera rotundifolia]
MTLRNSSPFFSSAPLSSPSTFLLPCPPPRAAPLAASSHRALSSRRRAGLGFRRESRGVREGGGGYQEDPVELIGGKVRLSFADWDFSLRVYLLRIDSRLFLVWCLMETTDIGGCHSSLSSGCSCLWFVMQEFGFPRLGILQVFFLGGFDFLSVDLDVDLEIWLILRKKNAADFLICG